MGAKLAVKFLSKTSVIRKHVLLDLRPFFDNFFLRFHPKLQVRYEKQKKFKQPAEFNLKRQVAK